MPEIKMVHFIKVSGCFFAAFKLVATIFNNLGLSASPLGDLAHTFYQKQIEVYKYRGPLRSNYPSNFVWTVYKIRACLVDQ